MEQDFINYMGHLWVQVDGDTATIGVNSDGLDEITDLLKVTLPEENENVSADEICGELETDGGSLNLYSPVDGTVVEINQSVVENPDIIQEDHEGEGWLFKIQASDEDDLRDFVHGRSSDDDDDEDEDEDDEDDDYDVDEEDED